MNSQQQEFIDSIAPKAQEIQAKYGVPASIVIAQAALESGWGANAKGNNLFGIKAGGGWGGSTIDVATHEYANGAMHGETDAFRAYNSTEDSMENYGKFLAGNSRYAGVIGADAHDAANALQRAGYATDPQYASKLKSIISSNELTRFDDATYRGYEADETRFEETQKRLRQQREADPKTWDDFMAGFFQMLISMFVNSLGHSHSEQPIVESAPRTPPVPKQVQANNVAPIPARA